VKLIKPGANKEQHQRKARVGGLWGYPCPPVNRGWTPRRHRTPLRQPNPFGMLVNAGGGPPLTPDHNTPAAINECRPLRPVS